MSLTPRQQRFVEEYLIDLVAAQAAIRAGYSAKTAEQQGSRLLSNAKVAQAIAAARTALSARTEITQEMVLQRLWEIATADPNEISQYRRTACRYCHSNGHRYHWRDMVEWEEARAQARSRKKAAPSKEGGFGFDQNAAPHPDCPRCNGAGIGRTYVADTRRLKRGARLLYAGMKETRDGVEAKMHDQMAALDKVARILGAFKDKLEVDMPENLVELLSAARERAIGKRG